MEEVNKNLDDLFKVDKLLESYNIIRDSKIYDKEADYLWRKSRLYYHIAIMLRDIEEDKSNSQNLYENFVNSYKLDFALPVKEMRKYFNEKGLEFAKLAVQEDSNNFATHKWYGLCLTANLQYKNINDKVASSFDIYKHFMKALELNSSNATLYYCLGSWHYEITKLPNTVKSLSRVISGKKYSSTYKDALKYFLKAEKIRPDLNAHNLLMIATTYNVLGDEKHCLEYLEKLINSFAPKCEEDKKAIAKANILYQTMSEKSTSNSNNTI